MVKIVSTYAAALGRYMPEKLITHGIKIWALCDHKGYCLISSVDGGMQGASKLRQWFNCPLDRTTRQVLWVLLGASPVLSKKLDGSGVYIAMDSFFTNPMLFECLASHDIFAVGTCRSDRTAGAAAYLESLDRTLVERGDMNFCRAGEMAFVRWKDSKDVTLCSTIHIAQPGEKECARNEGIDHFTPLPYEKRKKDREDDDDSTETTMQPEMRKDYCAYMGGVDTADQQNGSNAHYHKSCNNYWRRVMIEQSLTNDFLCFRQWVPVLKCEAQRRVEDDVGDTAQKERLGCAINELGRRAKLERAK
ncbi:unnamed protein product [Pylaiella littoralis]